MGSAYCGMASLLEDEGRESCLQEPGPLVVMFTGCLQQELSSGVWENVLLDIPQATGSCVGEGSEEECFLEQ